MPSDHKAGQDPKAGKQTPNADLQPEDTGTPASGNEGTGGRGTAAEAAMKQTSKTPHETGSSGEARSGGGKP